MSCILLFNVYLVRGLCDKSSNFCSYLLKDIKPWTKLSNFLLLVVDTCGVVLSQKMFFKFFPCPIVSMGPQPCGWVPPMHSTFLSINAMQITFLLFGQLMRSKNILFRPANLLLPMNLYHPRWLECYFLKSSMTKAKVFPISSLATGGCNSGSGFDCHGGVYCNVAWTNVCIIARNCRAN